MSDPLLTILDALRGPDWSDAFDDMLRHGKLGDVPVSRKQLVRAVDFLERLLDPARGASLRASLPLRQSRDLARISWRKIGTTLAPTVRLRLDEYVEGLEVLPPDTVRANGRKYSDDRVVVERHRDHIVVRLDKLATDFTPTDEEDTDAES